jgi:hypothetical protein
MEKADAPSRVVLAAWNLPAVSGRLRETSFLCEVFDFIGIM